MAFFIFDAGSNAKVTEAEEEIADGDLWGISLGTTTQSSSYSTWILISATPTRCRNLSGVAPEWVDQNSFLDEADSFSDGSLEAKLWYLRGMLS